MGFGQGRYSPRAPFAQHSGRGRDCTITLLGTTMRKLGAIKDLISVNTSKSTPELNDDFIAKKE